MNSRTSRPDSHPLASETHENVSSAPLSRRIPRRFLILLTLLLVVLTLGMAQRGTDLRVWWLSRQSEDLLRPQALKLNADATLCYVYAKKLFDHHKQKEALEAFQAAEKALPVDASDRVAQQTLAHLGYLYVNMGNWDAAARPLKRAQALNDDDPLVHLGMGLYFLERQEFIYAENQFNIVVLSDARNAEGWYYLGKTYYESRSYKAAVHPLEIAVKLEPANAIAWEQLGQTYADLRLFDKAIPAIRKACEIEPDNIAYLTALGAVLALNAQTQKEYQEAVTVLEDCIRRASDNDTAEMQLGNLHMRFHNLTEARRHLRRTLELNPYANGSWFNLAQVEQMLGHTACHDQAYRRYQQLQKYTDEVTAIQAKLGADHESVQTHLQLARFYASHNNLTGALSEYAEALSRDPQNAVAKAEGDKVNREYKEAFAKNPDGDYSHSQPPPFQEPWADAAASSNNRALSQK